MRQEANLSKRGFWLKGDSYENGADKLVSKVIDID
jgi:hypothetical protein